MIIQAKIGEKHFDYGRMETCEPISALTRGRNRTIVSCATAVSRNDPHSSLTRELTQVSGVSATRGTCVDVRCLAVVSGWCSEALARGEGMGVGFAEGSGSDSHSFLDPL